MTKPNREEAGFFDASIWESARRQGEASLKQLINDGLENTSNTCILIGTQTHMRPWVRYEILKSFRRGNHLLGVHINGVKAKDGTTKPLGANPLEYVGVTYSTDGRTATLWEKNNGTWAKYGMIGGSADYAVNVDLPYRGKGFNLGNWYKNYDWITNAGFQNFGEWLK
jgi:hypothetical protein